MMMKTYSHRLITVLFIQAIILIVLAIMNNFNYEFSIFTVITTIFSIYFFYIPFIKDENILAIPGLSNKGIFNKVIRFIYIVFCSFLIGITIFDKNNVFPNF